MSDAAPAIEACRLSTSSGGVHTLCGLQRVGHAGEVFALFGENSAGKRALIEIITSFADTHAACWPINLAHAWQRA